MPRGGAPERRNRRMAPLRSALELDFHNDSSCRCHQTGREFMSCSSVGRDFTAPRRSIASQASNVSQGCIVQLLLIRPVCDSRSERPVSDSPSQFRMLLACRHRAAPGNDVFRKQRIEAGPPGFVSEFGRRMMAPIETMCLPTEWIEPTIRFARSDQDVRSPRENDLRHLFEVDIV